MIPTMACSIVNHEKNNTKKSHSLSMYGKYQIQFCYLSYLKMNDQFTKHTACFLLKFKDFKHIIFKISLILVCY